MRLKREAAWLLLAATTTSGAQSGAFECLIEPSQVVEIRSPSDGVITSVAARRGDAIKRGQTLVELQSSAERAAVESARYRADMQGPVATARNRLQYAKVKLARISELEREEYASGQARDEAEAERQLAESELQSALENRELARIELKRAQEQLAMRTMVAPFNGVVLDRLLHPGDLAESGAGRKPVLRVAQIDPLRVDIFVPASAFGTVKPGMPVVVLTKVPAGRHAGTVSAVDKAVDAASATFVVRLDLANPTGAIAGGVRCNAEIKGTAVAMPAR
jgi:RND family efflux transporter MFP subunit